MNPAVRVLLAQVCGHHGGDGCGHCEDTYRHRRDRWGWTDQQIADDIVLYRDNRPAWYALAEATAAARGVEREMGLT